MRNKDLDGYYAGKTVAAMQNEGVRGEEDPSKLAEPLMTPN